MSKNLFLNSSLLAISTLVSVQAFSSDRPKDPNSDDSRGGGRGDILKKVPTSFQSITTTGIPETGTVIGGPGIDASGEQESGLIHGVPGKAPGAPAGDSQATNPAWMKSANPAYHSSLRSSGTDISSHLARNSAIATGGVLAIVAAKEMKLLSVLKNLLAFSQEERVGFGIIEASLKEAMGIGGPRLATAVSKAGSEISEAVMIRGGGVGALAKSLPGKGFAKGSLGIARVGGIALFAFAVSSNVVMALEASPEKDAGVLIDLIDTESGKSLLDQPTLLR